MTIIAHSYPCPDCGASMETLRCVEPSCPRASKRRVRDARQASWALVLAVGVIVGVWLGVYLHTERDRAACTARGGQPIDVQGGYGGWVCAEIRREP